MMEIKGTYKGFNYCIKTYGAELYLPLCTKIFNTVGQMKDYVDMRLIGELK